MNNHTNFRSRSGRTLHLAGCIFLAAASASFAAVYNWNGGSGDWDTTTPNWTGDGTVWPGTGTDNDAVFGGTAGAVAVTGSGGTVNDISFNTTAYTISGGTLTLNGASTPVITAAPGVSASISSMVNSATGFLKQGTGTLTMTGAGSTLPAVGVSAGTLRVNGGTISSTLGVTVGNALPSTGTLQISAGVLSTPSVTYISASSSAVRLEGGTLKADSINLGGTGSFVWGAGTLAHYTANGSSASADYSTAPVIGPGVYSGTVLNFTGDLTSSNGSVVDLGLSHLSAGVRFNRLLVTGNLDLVSLGDTLRFGFNPYFLRPDLFLAEYDYGSIPLIKATGTLSGTFTTLDIDSNVGDQTLPFAYAGVNAVTNPADLAMDTWTIEYDYAESTVWMHYKVSATVPEPATAGLIFLTAASARIASKLRRRRLHKDEDTGRFDDENADALATTGWFDASSKL